MKGAALHLLMSLHAATLNIVKAERWAVIMKGLENAVEINLYDFVSD